MQRVTTDDNLNLTRPCGGLSLPFIFTFVTSSFNFNGFSLLGILSINDNINILDPKEVIYPFTEYNSELKIYNEIKIYTRNNVLNSAPNSFNSFLAALFRVGIGIDTNSFNYGHNGLFIEIHIKTKYISTVYKSG